MARKKRNNHNNGIIVAVLIVCAIALRVLGKFDILIVPGGIVRSLICIALYIGWGMLHKDYLRKHKPVAH